MKNSQAFGNRKTVKSLFESLENRVLFAFGDADTDFGNAGRALEPFSSAGRTPSVTQMLVTSGGKILAGGTTGLTRFTSVGAVDSSFGSSGKITLSAAANFIAEAVDPSTNNIYVLVSASSGTGLFRYSANGKIDSGYGTGGTVTVTSSKTFQPQALTVQSDGKVIVAGVFKNDTNNTGRKVRVYRLKTDGTSDNTFDSDGAKEFNLGVGNFLAPVVFDKVVAVKAVTGGNIDVIGGSIDYSPAATDPDTGEFTDVSYDKATFAVARLTSAGALDTGYNTTGIARDDYATAEQIAASSIDSVLPTAAAVRSNDSVVVAGFAEGAVVAEFNASGTPQYTTPSTSNSQLGSPVGLAIQNDGRSFLVTRPSNSSGLGFAMAAVSSDGVIGNVIYTDDNDGSTTDITEDAGGGAAVTASDGRLLVGGGSDNFDSFEVEKFLVGTTSDARPDDFLNARANDIARDKEGGLHVAYFDAATTHLVYAHRNPNGQWDPSVVVDNGANAGQYVSIDTNSKNNPGIAYFDGNGGDLKLAQFDGSTWKLETVESKGSVGLYPSFTYDNADEPVVTYFNKTKGKLTFALKKLNTTWGYENVDASGDNVGRSSVLMASPKTQRYTVAYQNNTTGAVMWAGHKKGGTWDVKVAATTKGGADFISMAYGYYYEPMISYYDAFASDLKITTFYNGQFNVKTLATSGAQGLYTAGFFGDYYGNGQVFAYNKSQDKVTFFKNVLDTTPTNTDVVTGGGKYLSVDSNGSSTDLAFFDANTGKLKVRPGPSLT